MGPRLFTRLCKPLLSELRGKHGMRCSIYIDDMIFMNRDKRELLSNIATAENLFCSLGFTVNHEKSVLQPVQAIKHLGVIIDSNLLTLSLPRDKLDLVDRKCKIMLEQVRNVTIRDVCSLAGSFVAYSAGTQWGKLHYRKLDRDIQTALKKNCGNFDAFMSISSGIDNIKWWLTKSKEVPFYFGPRKPDLEIFSDASNKGWGCHCMNMSTGGRWSDEESKNHINWLELKACWLALESFANYKSGIHISLRMDNTSAIAYVNKQGGTSEKLNTLAFDIWEWCQNRNLWISAKHIPGVENIVADYESRVFNDTSEWSLSEAVFEQIMSVWGSPDIDLFASRLNHKVPKYISWGPNPNCYDVDALSTGWGDLGLCYAFPPFSIIGKVLSKALVDKAELLLVVPEWKTQHWFPMIKQLRFINVVGKPNPVRLHMTSSTLTLPFDNKAVHPIWHRLNLLCYRLSGKH